ncbi:hypothetical protein [Neorhizobium alkalisoli]|jgi:hypothetical protein|uniref:Uncharacterized protein n=1 Tax=Neorhizobium alkalisoli TaxID=528178 RepID=A0A561PVU6_9HYPH|nr:hypothetical protein [Neorhizobium alkalisoli]TWF42231.1 hypothetical protein FHW37_1239 [Neorhizobium alkalisoli]
MLELDDLEAEQIYWARRKMSTSNDQSEVVQISTVFGLSRDYWSVAMLGTDQHYSVTDFVFLKKIEPGI